MTPYAIAFLLGIIVLALALAWCIANPEVRK